MTPIRTWLLALGAALPFTGMAQQSEKPPEPVQPPSSEANNSRKPWEEYDKFIQSRNAVAALGPDLFGEQVSLYNGALSFAATDASVPGNSSLPFAIARTFSASARAVNQPHDLPFADWDLDLPRIEGTFGPNWHNNRCSSTAEPPPITFAGRSGPNPTTTATYDAQDYWQGTSAQMPGGGELLVADQGAPRPANSVVYPWMTSAHTYFRCLGDAQQGITGIANPDGSFAGEGFEALTADGTKYTFNHMAQYNQPQLEQPRNHPGGATPLERKRNVLYASRVEDRFGHWVKYHYSNSATQPARLTAITAGYVQPGKGGGNALDVADGREIAFTYNAQGQIATATVKAAGSGADRTWTYQYDYTAGSNFGSLTTVVLPDDAPGKPSRWTIAFKPLANASITFEQDPEVTYTCENPTIVTGVNNAPSVSGTITHPAGASAVFELKPKVHQRSNVPRYCYNENEANTVRRISHYILNYDALSLVRKQLSGPGQPVQQWLYDYASDGSWASGTCMDPNLCAMPVCTTEACATGRAVTTVDGPGGDWQRYSFGNSYRYDEGKLRKVETGSVAYSGAPPSILQTQTTGYELAQSGFAFAPVGRSLRHRGDGFDSAYPRPRKSSTTSRDGSSFSWQALGFDAYGRPTGGTHSSSLGFSRTEQLQYFDDTTLWVLGQPLSTYDVATGTYPQQTSYDPATALPTHQYAFGKLQQRRTYHSGFAQRGRVHQVYDGSDVKATTLDLYHRGFPRSVTYHNGDSESATVNNHGEITSLTDAAGFTTSYGYDPMGRINLITPPAGDLVAWTPTTIEFAPVPANELQYGLPLGHWRRTVSTGNQRAVTYYDGQWRPLLSREFDAADENGTRRMVRRSFDHQGRETFVSYPQRNLAAYNSSTTGTTTAFDALGRTTLQQADSEQGVLNTQYQYLSGFRTQVTNPRGHSTTSWYQAYSEPTDQFPVRIDSPESVTTLVDRDVFGKPRSMTRNAIHAGLPITLTRRWVYDQHQRLCKTIEPESGAEILDYDASGNVAWKAPGQAYTGTAGCDREYVAANAKISQEYDQRNRPTVTSFGDNSPAIARTWTPDGLPLTVASSISTWTYEYNRRRLLTRETLALSGIVPNGTLAAPLQVNYQHDALGHVSAWDYPGSGGSLVLNPNALGEARQTGSYASNLSYHPNGMLAGMSYGNGVFRSIALNARQLPYDVVENGVMADRYSYDPNGNITGIADLHTSDNFQTGRTFSYDGRDRMTGLVYDRLHAGTNSNGTPAYHNFVSIAYGYDGLDNLRSYRSPPGTGLRNMDYEYNPTTWRLTRITSPDNGGSQYINYVYDNRGNAVSRGAWGDQVFDLGNRLRSMVGQGVAASYDYDGHGRRTLISEPGKPRQIQMYNQGGLLLAEIGINGSDTVTELKSYFYNGRNPIAERLRTPGSDSTSYVHADHLGSPMAKTSAFGSVFERTMFEPYGLKVGSAFNPPYGIGLFPDSLGFAGHRTDRVSGLSYMQQRYYDPVAGRFISMDPVTADSDKLFNRYGYANNNPITLVDTDGRAAALALRMIPGATRMNQQGFSALREAFAFQNAPAVIRTALLNPATGKIDGYLVDGEFVAVAANSNEGEKAEEKAPPRKTIIEDNKAADKADRLKGRQASSYEQIKDRLSRGERGGNQHRLHSGRGDGLDKTMKSVELDGSGKGRGGDRVIYTEKQNEIIIHDIRDYH